MPYLTPASTATESPFFAPAAHFPAESALRLTLGPSPSDTVFSPKHLTRGITFPSSKHSPFASFSSFPAPAPALAVSTSLPLGLGLGDHANVSIAPPKPQPISPGRPGVLRLNIEATRRRLSDSAPQTDPSSGAGPTSGSSGSSTATVTAAVPPRQALLRKKSGELVKPSLKSKSKDSPTPPSRARTRSEPATPVGPKGVRFDSQLEHVRLFLAQQRPTAVSRDGSPVDTSEGEEFPFSNRRKDYFSSDEEKPTGPGIAIRLPNMPPKDARDVDGALKDDVKLESLSLAADAHTLDGSVLVRNIAFEKRVAARFTLDAWQTTSEVTARYLDSPAPSTIDRFVFKVRLSDMLGKIVGRTMEIALRYEVAGRELWDNNARENYRVVFEKAVSKPAFVASPESAAPSPSAIVPAAVPAPLPSSSSKPAPVPTAKSTPAPAPIPRSPAAWSKDASRNDQLAHLRKALEEAAAEDPRTSPPVLAKIKKAAFVNSNGAASVLERVGKSSSSSSSSSAGSGSGSGGGASKRPHTQPSTASSTLRPPRTFTLSPLSPTHSPRAPLSPLKSPEPLSARYDFSAAVREPWSPPSVSRFGGELPGYLTVSSGMGMERSGSGSSIASMGSMGSLGSSSSFGSLIASSPSPSMGSLQAHATGFHSHSRSHSVDHRVGGAGEAGSSAGNVRAATPRAMRAPSSYLNLEQPSASLFDVRSAPAPAPAPAVSPPAAQSQPEPQSPSASQSPSIQTIQAPTAPSTSARRHRRSSFELGPHPWTIPTSPTSSESVVLSPRMTPYTSTIELPSEGEYSDSSSATILAAVPTSPTMSMSPVSQGSPLSDSHGHGHGHGHGHLFPAWEDAASISPINSVGSISDMSLTEEGGSLESTPSVTIASTPTESPHSPLDTLSPGGSPPLYMGDLSIVGEEDSVGGVGSKAWKEGASLVPPDLDQNHYSFFLDRFCFYTGPGIEPSAVDPSAMVTPRRIHSESSVESYFSPRNAHFGNTNFDPRGEAVFPFTHARGASVGSLGGARSLGSLGGSEGFVTPTRTRTRTGEEKSKSPSPSSTPRAGTPSQVVAPARTPVAV